MKWIVDGVCKKEEISPDAICNLGYACEGCPFNKDIVPEDEHGIRWNNAD